MSHSVSSTAAARQALTVDLDQDARSTTVDPDFLVDLFNAAIDESSWKNKQEALATALDIDKAYLSRVRAKEKPLNLKILRALPDDIESILASKWAEAKGFIVVAPLHGQDAVRMFVAGALGMLTASRLPERSGGQLKADLDSSRSVERRRA